jgi:hypothetical protein
MIRRTLPNKNENRNPMKTKILSEATLKEDMKQNWTWNGTSYTDQFHFEIMVQRTYKLYWHGDYITETYSLNTARVIANILLNDKILAG